MMMAMVIVLSLCACGGESGNAMFSSEPTGEELKEINEYEIALNVLDAYVEDGENSYVEDGEEGEVEWKGSLALEHYYNVIKESKGVDKWIGTEYLHDERTRQEILDSFKIIEDVRLYGYVRYYDRMSNWKKDMPSWSIWNYNEKGLLVSVEHDGNQAWFSQIEDMAFYPYINALNCSKFIEYDEKDNITKITYKDDWGKDVYISIPKYDSDGNIISEYVKSEDEDCYITYVYNNEKRVERIESKIVELKYNGEDTLVYDYTYDSKGNVLKEEYKRYGTAYITEYVYDDNNNFISSTQTIMENSGDVVVDEWSFKYDNQDRITAIDIIKGEDNETGKITFVYGDYYIYAPTK